MHIPQHIANAIVDPTAYADRDRLDEAFAWLRREAPLARVQPDGFNPFWPVTRHADIQVVEQRSDIFRAGLRSTAVLNAAAERQSEEAGVPVRTLVQMDNPDHLAFRRLTQDWFLPKNLRKLEARVRELAREQIDRMEDMGGRCDFAKDIALMFPLRVIMELLGVPREDEMRMLKLTQELFGPADPELSRDIAAKTQAANYATLMDFITYFNAVTEDRRARPRDDLATVIANGQVRGQPIGQLEAMGYYVIIAAAGHDTTSNSTSSGLWALCDYPDQFAKLKADLGLIPAFIEESIRWETPVKHFMRTAAEDTELSGNKIAKGEWLMLAYHSGNRDEAVFDDPFRFEIERTPNKHIAFGYGAHICLGQHLGRMEMKIFWEELLPRLASVELDGEPKRTEATFVSGPKSVPVRFRFG